MTAPTASDSAARSPRGHRFRLIVRALVTGGSDSAMDFDTDELRIGRSPGLEIQLPHPDVAPLALRITRARGPDDSVGPLTAIPCAPGVTVRASVGEVPLAPGTRHLLCDGDVLEVCGRFGIACQMASDGSATASSERTGQVAYALVAAILASTATRGEVTRCPLSGRLDAGAHGAPAVDEPHLVGEAGIANTRVFALPMPGGRVIVGREARSDILLLDPELSREHAVFARSWQGITVADLGSKNGTTVDGLRVSEPVALRHGARIAFGRCRLRLVDPVDHYLQALESAPGDGDGADPVASADGASARSSEPTAGSGVVAREVRHARRNEASTWRPYRAFSDVSGPAVTAAAIGAAALAGLLWLFV